MIKTVEVVGEYVRICSGSDVVARLTFSEVCAAAHALREHLLSVMPPEIPRATSELTCKNCTHRAGSHRQGPEANTITRIGWCGACYECRGVL